VQASRDAAVLYSRGVDFSQAGSKELVRRLSNGLDLSPTGNGVVIFSQVMIVRRADCIAGGYAEGCPNEGSPVFLNRIVLGNTTLRPSNYGSPTGMNPKGNISSVAYLSDPSARGNAELAAELLAAGVAQRQGDVANLVEVWFDTPDLSAFGTASSRGVYAKSIF
jgi:hypothetical protein